MKKITLILIAFAVILNSCTKEPIQENNKAVNHSPIELSFTASFSASKAVLNGDRSVSFSAGDAIAIFANGNKYKLTTTTGGATATFTGTAEEAATYYALFPYSDDATISEGVISGVNLPKTAEVTTPGTFAPKQAIFVAKTTNTSLSFKSAVALLKITVPADVVDLTEVLVFNRTISPLTGAITGTFNVTPGDGAPTVVVTVKNGEESEPHTAGISAPKDNVLAAGDYYIPVLPSSLTKGLDMRLTYADKTTGRAANGGNLSFEAGEVYNLGTVYKLNGFIYNSFQSGAIGETVTGGNESSVSVVDNPLNNANNNSTKVMKLDMTSRANNSSTSGVIKLNPISTIKFPATWYRTFFSKVRIKFYSAGDLYCPRFTVDADLGRGFTKERPNRVNGVTVNTSDDYTAAYNTDDWNVLEWDLASTGVDTNSEKQAIANIEFRFFKDYIDNSLARPAYSLLCYVDDIAFLN